MVNEDILTSLRNAVDHGDSLENAIKLALNSGYNSRDVQEAAQFVSGGTITNFQTQPSERLAMPAQKKLFSQNPVLLKSPPPQYLPQVQPQSQSTTNIPLQPQSQPQSQTQSQTQSQPRTQSTTDTPLQFQPIQQQTPNQNSLMQDLSDIKQNISTGYTNSGSGSGYVSSSSSSSSPSLSQEIEKMKPHENYIKEIILLVVLLLLVGVLISTFIFKDQLLGLFTGI